MHRSEEVAVNYAPEIFRLIAKCYIFREKRKDSMTVRESMRQTPKRQNAKKGKNRKRHQGETEKDKEGKDKKRKENGGKHKCSKITKFLIMNLQADLSR